MAQEKFLWTRHCEMKMRYYRLSPSLIKRVIRYPQRTEEGIIENGIAVMRKAQSKRYSEVWALYVLVNTSQLRVITAWRYPGKSPERNPIPEEILREVRTVL